MFNELERKVLRKALHTPELKDYAIRLFNSVLLNNSTINAPEIRTCLLDLQRELEDEKQVKEVKPNNYAE